MTDTHRTHEEPVVFKDKRRVDPTTGEVRDPFTGMANPGDPAQASQPITAQITADSEEFAAMAASLAERTADLQRITAEYANYRKRVDRDRESWAIAARASVVTDLLAVLDDIELAKAHGDLSGAFKSVAERLIGILERQGLQGFGTVGDPFDPAHHEAVQFGTSTDVSEPTVTSVFRRGYQFKDKSLRAAVVVVTGPEHEVAADLPADVAAEVADVIDRIEDAQARSEQESKQGGVPDLDGEPGSGPSKPADQA